MSLKELAPTYHTRICSVADAMHKSEKLLDIGCSDGYFDWAIARKAKNIYGIDINQQDLKYAAMRNPGGRYLLAYAENLPYKNETFDTIVCMEVLEHLAYDTKAISEIHRVSKKHACIIITVPSNNYPFTFDPINCILKIFDKKMRFGVWGYGHKRLYDVDALARKLKRCGIEVKKVRYMSHFLVGIFENSYLANHLQRSVKSDPDNKAKIANAEVHYDERPLKLLLAFRDMIIFLDNLLFSKSKSSLGIMLVCEKSS